jgi:hypothetical protein
MASAAGTAFWARTGTDKKIKTCMVRIRRNILVLYLLKIIL